MSEYEFTVSLRIRHPTIDPATISAMLGIEPQHTWRAGEPRCDPAGAELGGAHHDWMGRLRLELPSDFLTSLGRMYLAVALDIHPHSPLKTSVSRPN
ncbi:MAG: hypothetical protein KGO22_02145 [Gammaproteobacteria bacterium]|nr:hypothetical protein [Gammaproteobacteria bacterium]